MKNQEHGKKETTTLKSETEPTVEPSPLDDRVLAVMKTLRENGVPITSTLLRDKLALDKELGRGQIRRVMSSLEKQGKVAINEKMVGKQKQYVYSLKEP